LEAWTVGLTLRLLRYDKRLKTKTKSFRHHAWEAQSGGHKILLSVRCWVPFISYLHRQTCSALANCKPQLDF
jgi:hypothetical protein